jgi:hypothetical protein
MGRDRNKMAPVRVPDEHVEQLHAQGYTAIEGFVRGQLLRQAQHALWLRFPRPEEYHADPERFPEYSKSQFAGLHPGACPSWELNRLAVHDDLIDFAERVLGSDDLNLYKIELWAKYAGAVDYDQHHHRDYGNHSLVVPRRADPVKQLTTFLLLSDVTEADGPTKVIPFDRGSAVPYWPNHAPDPALRDQEVSITGPAGTLFAYRTDILHRGSQMTGERASRFALLADFRVWGDRWLGKMAWPNHAASPHQVELLENATVRQRALFGFPAPGDPYWDDQTIADVGRRYPRMDMRPYRLG